MNQPLKIELKKIRTAVRPPRFVTFIDLNDHHWHSTCERVIEWYSQFWGGAYNFIVPTDGITIDDSFWQLLEIFQPDYCVSYLKTQQDILLADPEVYEKTKEIEIETLLKSFPTLERAKAERIADASLQDMHRTVGVPLEITEKLKREIINKLNPFHYNIDILVEKVVSKSPAHRFTTPITAIFNERKKEINERPRVIDFDLTDFPKEFALWVRSRTGSTRPLQKNTIKSEDILQQQKEIKYSLSSREHKRNETTALYNLIKQRIKEIHFTPFWYSIYGLDYFITEFTKIYIDPQPVILVIGDLVKDFCLYYNLSRIVDNVFWLSSSIISAYDSNENINGFEMLLYHLVNDVSKVVSFQGSLNRRIILTSCSQAEDYLKDAQNQLSQIELVKDAFKTRLIIQKQFNATESIRIPSILLERENTSNVYLEQFLNNMSLNLLRTPKPRTF